MPTFSAEKALSRWLKSLQMPCDPWAVRPFTDRSNSLSAAFRNLEADAKVDLTHRYDQRCSHYRMTPAPWHSQRSTGW
jgi:hypothetical protein